MTTSENSGARSALQHPLVVFSVGGLLVAAIAAGAWAIVLTHKHDESIDNFEQKIGELQGDIGAVREDVYENSNKIDDVGSDLTKKVDDLRSALSNRISGIESEISNKIDGLRSSWSAQLDEHKQSISRFEEDVNQLQGEVGEVRGDIGTNVSKIENVGSELNKQINEFERSLGLKLKCRGAPENVGNAQWLKCPSNYPIVRGIGRNTGGGDDIGHVEVAECCTMVFN